MVPLRSPRSAPKSPMTSPPLSPRTVSSSARDSTSTTGNAESAGTNSIHYHKLPNSPSGGVQEIAVSNVGPTHMYSPKSPSPLSPRQQGPGESSAAEPVSTGEILDPQHMFNQLVNNSLQGRPWYLPQFTRSQAEDLLGQPDLPLGTFLVRRSSQPSCLALSHVIECHEPGLSTQVGHGIIYHHDGPTRFGWSLEDQEDTWATVDDLLSSLPLNCAASVAVASELDGQSTAPVALSRPDPGAGLDGQTVPLRSGSVNGVPALATGGLAGGAGGPLSPASQLRSMISSDHGSMQADLAGEIARECAGRPWFKRWSRTDAEAHLGQAVIGSFVVRPSSSGPDSLVLSHRTGDGSVGHGMLRRDDRGWSIENEPYRHGLLKELLLSLPLSLDAYPSLAAAKGAGDEDDGDESSVAPDPPPPAGPTLGGPHSDDEQPPPPPAEDDDSSSHNQEDEEQEEDEFAEFLAPLPSESLHGSIEHLQVVVVAPFQAEEAFDLNLAVGQVVEVHDMKPNGWWYGQVSSSGQKGWFPSSFTERLRSANVAAKRFRPHTDVQFARQTVDAPVQPVNRDQRTLSQASIRKQRLLRTSNDDADLHAVLGNGAELYVKIIVPERKLYRILPVMGTLTVGLLKETVLSTLEPPVPRASAAQFNMYLRSHEPSDTADQFTDFELQETQQLAFYSPSPLSLFVIKRKSF